MLGKTILGSAFGLGSLVLVAAETPTERLNDARTAWLEEDWSRAVSLLDELESDESLGEYARARVSFAKGVVLAEEREDSPVTTALEPFRRARVLAGRTGLRLDAQYNGAWVELDVAEQAFRRVEASLQPAAPAGTPPGMAPAAPAADDEAPSFEELLAAARTAYHQARERFIQRLSADWRDEDTRANLEWIQRRLDELDELEQQQEEQEQQEQQDQQDQKNQDSEDSSDENEQDPEQQDSQDENQESQDSENQDGQDSDNQDQQQPSDEQEQDEPEEPSEEDLENPDPGEEPTEPEEAPAPPEPSDPENASGEQEASEPEAPQPLDREATEEFLTKEEMQRLLDRLEEQEREGERVRAALRKARRVPVERDW